MIMFSNVALSVCPCPMQCMQSHWRRSATQFMYGIVKTACIIAQAWYVVFGSSGFSLSCRLEELTLLPPMFRLYDSSQGTLVVVCLS